MRRLRNLLALLVVTAFGVSGCSQARASASSYPDFGSILDLAGSAIPGSGSAYAAGTTFYPGGANRLSLWVQLTLANATGLSAGVNLETFCGYLGADVNIPTVQSDLDAPTLLQTQTMTGTAGANAWHLVQTGSITGSKGGCALKARSANASAGGTGDEIIVYAYGSQ